MRYLIRISYSHNDLDSWEEGHQLSLTIYSDYDISNSYEEIAYAYLKGIDSQAREYQTELFKLDEKIEL